MGIEKTLMSFRKPDMPEPLRPFVDLGFTYDPATKSGNNYHSDCPFCGKIGKLYINGETQAWDCKSCSLKGNFHTYLRLWYNMHLDHQEDDGSAFIRLANDRQLDPTVLKEAGIVYDGLRYVIPTINQSGSIVNFRFYKIGGRLIGLSGVPVHVFGEEYFGQKGAGTQRVFLCAGEWDAIALRDLLIRSKEKGICLGIPGEGTWKPEWNEYCLGRDVVCCYDADTPGEKGAERVYGKVRSIARSFTHIDWPEGVPEGFDVRDFATKDGTYEELLALIKPYQSTEERERSKADSKELIPISSSARPKFQTVLDVYRKHMHMTEDLENALRVIFAVVLTTKIGGSPLWVHLVAPPGGGKTALLMSVSMCPSCYFVSTLTPQSLVSGFPDGPKGDPSLLPKIDQKCLVIKDFTEILAIGKQDKDKLFATLRGAYDGEVSKAFGNGSKSYTSHFNLISGVTQQIYSERSASLGERFLMFHVIKGVGFDAKDAIRSAIMNVGKVNEGRSEMSEAARLFLEVAVNEDDLPFIPPEIVDKMIAISEIVAMLRASVERDFRGDRKLLYRPQHEMGTRLSEQFTKIMLGLGLINSPPSIGDAEYKVMVRIAVDSCVGFNLEAVASLLEKGGQTLKELSEDCNLAPTTLRDQVDDLRELGVIRAEKSPNETPGRPMLIYYASSIIKTLWETAGLTRINGEVKSLSKERQSLNIKAKRPKQVKL